jgi:Ser/Thr protein kinase RdoA (MazF antagonist)
MADRKENMTDRKENMTDRKENPTDRKENPTDLFLSLTPEAVLAAVEDAGLRCNPVCLPLNSYENRVYDIELEDETRVVAKFYRPQRWSREQILEEHRFMNDLEEAEVPICRLRRFPDGTTLRSREGIFYCLYDRFGGRAPQDIDHELAERIGMLLGRLHAVGAAGKSEHRLRLDANTYVRSNLKWLAERGTIPRHSEERYLEAANTLAELAGRSMHGVPVQRIHGDFHAGNLLLREGVLHVLDFDDHVVGPAVQDFWLLLQGRDAHTHQLMESLIEGYEQFRAFDRSTLQLIEPLRALRRIHYTAWLAKRWHDPAFPLTWPHFGTETYWNEEVQDLEEMVTLIRNGNAGTANAAVEPEPELTNKDFFWDWEEK